MRQVLVPIDPASEPRTRSAVDEVVGMYRQDPIAIRLVRIQPKLTGDVAMFFGSDELRRLQQQAGDEDLQLAKSLLDAAAVPYTSTVLVGRSAETIARAARDFGCDRIVFGSEPVGIATRVFGSLAQQVRHLLGPSGATVIGS